MKTKNVVIKRGKMTAEVSPLGAELQSLKYDGREYLYDGSADWSGRAPILFPVAGRLREDKYKVGDAFYALPQHGFARRQMFDVVKKSKNSVQFALADNVETREGYPFGFSLMVTYTLREGGLDVSAVVFNYDEKPIYFGYGNHEAFVVGADKSEYSLRFEKAEDLVALHAVDGLLTGDGNPLGVGITELPLKGDYFKDSATLIFENINSREVTLMHRGALMLRLRFDMPNLLVWCKSPKTPFLCIEPWQNLPDKANTDFDFIKKPGVVTLAPGEHKEFKHSIDF